MNPTLKRLLPLVLMAALALPACLRPAAAGADNLNKFGPVAAAFGEFRDHVEAVLETADLPGAEMKEVNAALKAAHRALRERDRGDFAAAILWFSNQVFDLYEAGYLSRDQAVEIFDSVLTLLAYLEQENVLPQTTIDQVYLAVGAIRAAVQPSRCPA